MEAGSNVKAWLEARVQVERTHWQGRSPATPYLSIEDFVLQHGREYNPAPYAEKVSSGEMGQCFKNAYQLLISDEKLRYAEGFAWDVDVLLPLQHAWCVDVDGNVIDPTWDNGESYYGVVFELQYVLDVAQARRKYGVLDASEIGFPLVRGRHKYLGDGKVKYDLQELLKANQYDEE